MYSSIVKGNVKLKSNGLASCCGGCSICTSPITFTGSTSCAAFSFELCAIEVSSMPSLEFGLEFEDGRRLAFEYFAFLSDLRASRLDPHIPSDGIAVSIRLLVRNTRLSLYVNEVLLPQTFSIHSCEFCFFINVSADRALIFTPFVTDSIQPSFFPYLVPNFWISDDSLHICDSIIRADCPKPVKAVSSSPLDSLPVVSTLRYFEVTLRHCEPGDSGIHFGLAELIISAADSTVTALGFPETVSLPGNLTAGRTIGIGIFDSGEVLLTLDGARVLFGWSPPLRGSPAIAVFCLERASELMVNFGQFPFTFSEVKPLFGWCFCSYGGDEGGFSIGVSSTHHLLNFFVPYLATRNGIDSHLARQPLRDGERFEVTAINPDSTSALAVGLSDCDCSLTSMFGSIGVDSGDGTLHRGSSPVASVWPARPLGPNETLGLFYDCHRVSAFRNGQWHRLVDDFPLPPIPHLSVKGAVITVFNRGEFPFVSEPHLQNEGVRLFNGVFVTLTNANLKEIGVSPGDSIEARDLSFSGTFVGEFNGYFLVRIPGIEDAVALNITDPIFVRRLLRPLTSQQPIMRTCLISRRCELYESTRFLILCATPLGLALLLGGSVLRPIEDFVNNAPCFALTGAREICRIENSFDVCKLSDGRLCLAMDQTGDSELYFRFFGFGFVLVKNARRFANCGNHRSGIGYAANQHLVDGSVMQCSRIAFADYQSRPTWVIPGVVQHLIASFNRSMMAPPDPNDTALPTMEEWSYDSGPAVTELEKPTLILEVLV
jgi:hypothetical protein